MIFETIISTVDASGSAHITPFGVRYEDDLVVISPYKPSKTLDNILKTQCAVMNLTDDVRVFAGALTGHGDWALVPSEKVACLRLADSLHHVELKLASVREDSERPQLLMQQVSHGHHRPFAGFNRAQAAVIELAVLVSRLHMLPKEKVETEFNYLKIAIEKTAGERELLAWQWLEDKMLKHYNKNK